MTIRIPEEAYDELVRQQGLDGVPPSIRARKFVLDKLEFVPTPKDMELPPLPKKMDLGVEERLEAEVRKRRSQKKY